MTEPTQNLKSINDAISEYLMASVGFEHQFESLLDDLEQLRADLIRRAQEVDQQRREESENDRKLIKQLRQELKEIQEERDQLRRQLDQSIVQGSEIGDELRKLRALMLKQAKLMMGGAPSTRTKEPAVVNEPAEVESADPVALAVMAQLASLNPADS